MQRRVRNTPALETLVRLPIRHFFTTNYDRELEFAYRREKPLNPLDVIDWTDAERSADLVARWSEQRNATCVYLHGCADRPRSIVLTEEDYQRLYFRTSGNSQRLAAILLLHPVLFVGFSLTDPDLMPLLRQANTLCFEGARHFALIGLRSKKDIEARLVERSRLRRKYGVAAIFFKPGPRYEGLMHLLRYLEGAPKWPPDKRVEMPEPK